MSFDIHALDEEIEENLEEKFSDFQDALLDLFLESPEGIEYGQDLDEFGSWVAYFLYYEYNYIGLSLSEINSAYVDEMITEIFPRKISILDPKETEDAIPELIAFWTYLGREFELPNAPSILALLRSITPKRFTGLMMDPANFGMAKSFVMAGTQEGFDMTNQKDLDIFVHLHNARMMAKGLLDPGATDLSPLDDFLDDDQFLDDQFLDDQFLDEQPLDDDLFSSRSAPSPKAKKKKKDKRKQAKASRRKNRKK